MHLAIYTMSEYTTHEYSFGPDLPEKLRGIFLFPEPPSRVWVWRRDCETFFSLADSACCSEYLSMQYHTICVLIG